MPLDEKSLLRLTKAMSLLLRHNSGNKLRIDANGYAAVDEVCSVLSGFDRFEGVKVTPSMLADAVADPSKTRFGLSDDSSRIRALSGHSFPVDLGLDPFEPSGDLYFGTSRDAMDKIMGDGFLRGAKLKVRLLESYEEAAAVASFRSGDPLVVAVDACRLMRDGWTFGKSQSGEVLTDRFGAEYCSEAFASTAVP